MQNAQSKLCVEKTVIVYRESINLNETKGYPFFMGAVNTLNFPFLRDVGSNSNLGAPRFKCTIFLKKKGAFSKNKKGTYLFIAKS